ncbi:MAG: diaminopimelate epimerase [Alphaproteobacteria bacterium]|nr:diaminopimelate epimerase [Alphaproteobacteria bacterium]
MVAFNKMHGLGNDFIVVENRNNENHLSKDEIKLMSHRRFGIGCDQFIMLEKPTAETADVFMRIYNPDASESGACGNATRCVASMVSDQTGKADITIQTQRGLLACQKNADGSYSVDMGVAMLDARSIPTTDDADVKNIPTGQDLPAGFAVGMGNPHLVIFVEDADEIELDKLGPTLEHSPFFPERTNVEFVSKNSDGSLRMRVWERSAGITMACGSGACAVGVAAFKKGIINSREVDIHLDGGKLTIEYREDGHVIMTGPVAHAFDGHFDLSTQNPIGGKEK